MWVAAGEAVSNHHQDLVMQDPLLKKQDQERAKSVEHTATRTKPNAEAVAIHNQTRLLHSPWCEVCGAAGAKEAPQYGVVRQLNLVMGQ
eukprot:6106164-Amphidinium_carterae.4